MCIRRIVSASIVATDSCRMRSHACASTDNGIVFVTTHSSNTDSVILLIALPDKTGCVQYAETLTAP